MSNNLTKRTKPPCFPFHLCRLSKASTASCQKNSRKGVAEQTEVPWKLMNVEVSCITKPGTLLYTRRILHWETNSQGTKTISQMKPNAKSSRSAPTPSSFASCSSPSSSSLNVSTWLSISTEKNTKKQPAQKVQQKAQVPKKANGNPQRFLGPQNPHLKNRPHLHLHLWEVGHGLRGSQWP